MNLTQFFERVDEQGLQLTFDRPGHRDLPGLNNEALFHLPLIAMTILMMAGGRRKPRSDRLGQIVGECFERTFSGFKGSSHHLGWSAHLRVRTVKALAFLELARLVEVDRGSSISATDRGRDVLEVALNGTSNLSMALSLAERNYRDVSVERQIELAL